MSGMIGGGKCTICESPGTNKSTCPLNPKAQNPNPAKHPLSLSPTPTFDEDEELARKTEQAQVERDAEDTGYEAYFEGEGESGLLELDTDDWLGNEAFIVRLSVRELEDEDYFGHMISIDEEERESFADYLSDISEKIHNPQHKLANERYTTPGGLFIEFTFSDDDKPESILVFDPDNNEVELSGEIYVGSRAADLGYRLDHMIKVIKNLPPLQ